MDTSLDKSVVERIVRDDPETQHLAFTSMALNDCPSIETALVFWAVRKLVLDGQLASIAAVADKLREIKGLELAGGEENLFSMALQFLEREGQI